MVNQLKFILSSQMRRSQQAQKTGGFTLIELLVAMIIAVLVITPLLGFMISILQDDRREQAKTTTEQEIKSALDYISQDMEQAVYIYDNTALNTTHSSPPASSGIQNQIPPTIPANGCIQNNTNNICQPILVFWKREFLSKNDTINGVNVGNANNQNDAFVYSLVAYYIITGQQGTNSTWSEVARIGRFEISDGIRSTPTTDIVETRQEPDPTISGKTDTVTYSLPPTKGFLSFNLATSGTLNVKMNQWQKLTTENYTDPGGADVQVLADYIDNSSVQIPQTTVCPSSNQLIPQGTSVSGFYVCVNNSDPTNISAQVFIRGNALARIQNNNPTYNSNNLPFFPTASIQIKGESYLYTK